MIRGVLELHYLGGPLAKRKILYINSPFFIGLFQSVVTSTLPFLFTLFWSCQWRRRRADSPWAFSTLLYSPVRGVPLTAWIYPHILGLHCDCQVTTFNSKVDQEVHLVGHCTFCLFFCRWTRIKLKILQYQSAFITHKTARVFCVCV